jgi:HlyD family secretion protein
MGSSSPKQTTSKSLPKDPDDFDQSIDIIRRPTQLWLFSLVTVGALSFVWSIFGSIKIEETGPSIFVPKGSVAFARSKASLGIVETIDVKIGQTVDKGQIVATLQVPSGLTEVENALESLRFQQDIEEQKLQSEITRLSSEIENTRQLINVFSDRLEDAKKLADKKIIAKDQYNNMLEKKLSLDAKNDSLVAQLKQATFRKEESVAQKFQFHDSARDKLDLQKNVRSPYTGKVIALSTRVGESLQNGAPVVQVAKQGASQSLNHIAYFTVAKGKKIFAGMPALVTPSTVSREEYGGIQGEVLSVSPFPISIERIRTVVGDEATVEQLRQGPVLEVNIGLNTTNSTPTGYSWTSGSGPNIVISPGLSATTYVSTEVKKPISFALPWVKNQLLGKPVDEINKKK